MPPPFDPLIPLAKGKTDLIQDFFRKILKEFSDSVLKAIALEIINTKYPQPDWLHVYLMDYDCITIEVQTLRFFQNHLY
ncbi:hypothetical protein TNCT_345711 [Trichonephila clavata]|uniref:Uncharacterized protein n=1 Tax=Trichonephila clavata TaxID=2740835 RepID=A0A8X6GCA8_TRICU|nr:hypothetical protein TNCT_345711 [Trichonephila clavata]